MMQECQKYLQNYKNVHYICNSSENTNIDSNKLDYISVAQAFHLFYTSESLQEFKRILKPNGYLVAVPMYYLESPSEKLISDVRKAIQVNISVLYKNDWKEFFVRDEVEVFDEIDFRFNKCTDREINEFCKNILSREHLKSLSKESLNVLEKVYYDYMHLFNENNSHMGFTIFILRKKEADIFNDPELYHSSLIEK